jgi:hypothetical protein
MQETQKMIELKRQHIIDDKQKEDELVKEIGKARKEKK